MKKIRLALLISGSGTTATAIIQACKSSELPIKPAVVIASSKEASGIQRIVGGGFSKENIRVIDPTKCTDRSDFAEKLLTVCEEKKVDIVGQYGWLPLTPKKFIQKYEGRIINQHPGPLDSFGAGDFGGKGMWGKRVHCAVLYFRRVTNHDFWTEATTHLVTAEFDKGGVIKRKKTAILPNDTVEDLQKRVLPIEHQVQIEALRDFAHNRVQVVKRDTPLIKEQEKSALEEAKKIAGILYPEG